MDLLAALSLSFFCITIYDRFLFYFLTEIMYQFLFSKNNKTSFVIGKGSILWFFFWIYISADFLYRANGYHYDWRNRIRLWKKFDLTGLYKGLYHIYSLFLATVNFNILIFKYSRSKSQENNNIMIDLKKQKKYLYVGLSLLFCVKYLLATFSYMDEINMFRGKILENVVISQGFMLYLIP